jgi:hypothetical protein
MAPIAAEIIAGLEIVRLRPLTRCALKQHGIAGRRFAGTV